jgi:hypothetical protein
MFAFLVQRVTVSSFPRTEFNLPGSDADMAACAISTKFVLPIPKTQKTRLNARSIERNMAPAKGDRK